MLDVVTKTTNLLLLDGVEPALHDAQRLLTVASLQGMTVELAAPVLDAVSNQIAVIVDAADRVALSESLRLAVEGADESVAEAGSAIVEANEGGDEDRAREAISAAAEAIDALASAATADHEAMRRAA
jgi:hypothetical protein